MSSDSREKGRGRGAEKERERNLDWLPPICAPTGNRTCDLLVYGLTLQPVEPLGQGNPPTSEVRKWRFIFTTVLTGNTGVGTCFPPFSFFNPPSPVFILSYHMVSLKLCLGKLFLILMYHYQIIQLTVPFLPNFEKHTLSRER